MGSWRAIKSQEGECVYGINLETYWKGMNGLIVGPGKMINWKAWEE